MSTKLELLLLVICIMRVTGTAAKAGTINLELVLFQICENMNFFLEIKYFLNFLQSKTVRIQWKWACAAL